MNLKYVCMIATLAWGASAAGAWAAGDVAAGEHLFKQKCGICHKIGPGAVNFVGPELNGVVGTKVGEDRNGYAFSDGAKSAGFTWDAAQLQKWLTNPAALIPGTKMIFPGLPKELDRDNVIAYVSQFKADGSK